MIDCPDSTALPSRRMLLNGALRLAAVIGGVSLLIASTRRSASAAPSRKPEMIEELDAEPSITWGEWTGWRITSGRHWPRYEAGDVIMVDAAGHVAAVVRAAAVARGHVADVLQAAAAAHAHHA